jgi:hypothetical protein
MDKIIIGALISGFFGPLFVYFVRKKLLTRRKKPDMIREALQTSSKVVAKIEHMREEFQADRIWITQFHNGGHFYPTGKSMAKFSIIYETVDVGVSSVQSNFQNIPVNLFSKSINHLLDNGTIEISDFKDETIATHGLKYVADSAGCKSEYLFAIRAIDDRFIGVLGVDYVKKKTKLSEEQVSELANHTATIGGVLANNLTT